MKTTLIGASLAAGLAFGAAGLTAQETSAVKSSPVEGKRMTVVAMAPQGGTYEFIAAGAGMEGKVVKNAPYSAEGVTETTRLLADGTRITRRSTSKIYRDGEGRTRREIAMGAVGPLAAEGDSVTMVTINDPVAKRMYVMRKGEKTAREIEVLHPDVDVEIEEAHGEPGEHEVRIIRKRVKGDSHEATANVWIEEEDHGGLREIREHDFTAVGPHAEFFSDEDAKKEDLGERMIGGVLARGTKTTTVIPAGKIGNDRPITITRERWYSDELQTVVLSKTHDPMSGDVTYELRNIVRAEPDPSLFEMPADVEVEEGPKIERRIHIERKVERDGI